MAQPAGFGQAMSHAPCVSAELQYGCTWVQLGKYALYAGERDAVRWHEKTGYCKDMSMYAIEDYSAVRHVMVKL